MDGIPFVFVDPETPPVLAPDADDVDEDIDSAEGFHTFSGNSAAVIRPGDIGLKNDRFPALFIDYGFCSEGGIGIPVDKHNPSAFSGKKNRNGPSVSDGATRGLPRSDHNGDFVFKPLTHG
jgi:hypothetical protein